MQKTTSFLYFYQTCLLPFVEVQQALVFAQLRPMIRDYFLYLILLAFAGEFFCGVFLGLAFGGF
jgi:hypothetical protein